MKKTTKKSAGKKPAARKSGLWKKLLAAAALLALAAAALLALVGAVVFAAVRAGKTPADPTPEAQTQTRQPSGEPSQPTEQTAQAPIQVETAEPVLLEDEKTGLCIVSMERVAGFYVEDGSDELVADVFAVTVENPTEKALEYGVLTLTGGDAEYTFNISTLLPGARLRVMEASRAAFPADAASLSAAFSTVSWFAAEPSLHGELFALKTDDGYISVTNVSDGDITGPIYVYYKNYADGVYIGGITYRAKVDDTLSPGEEFGCSAAHYIADGSEILFVTYVP